MGHAEFLDFLTVPTRAAWCQYRLQIPALTISLTAHYMSSTSILDRGGGPASSTKPSSASTAMPNAERANTVSRRRAFPGPAGRARRVTLGVTAGVLSHLLNLISLTHRGKRPIPRVEKEEILLHRKNASWFMIFSTASRRCRYLDTVAAHPFAQSAKLAPVYALVQRRALQDEALKRATMHASRNWRRGGWCSNNSNPVASSMMPDAGIRA